MAKNLNTTQSTPSHQRGNWARELSKGLIQVEQLASHKMINQEEVNTLNQIKHHLDIRIPNEYLDDIKQGNKVLAKQFIPTDDELFFSPEELEDPIGDELWTPTEGITHRYPDRVLLKPTYMCAGYCRFCFRRYRVSHSKYNLKEDAYKKAIAYIAEKKEIEEVILTGGDPLTLTDKALSQILQDLNEMAHIKILRFHTRVPSLLPSRIDLKLIQMLKSTNKTIWISAHINHANEFKAPTKTALAHFVDNGIPVIMQTVLLKGVNNSTKDLIHLFKTAIENKVKPYYLHYPDLAKGTKHFRIPFSEALLIVKNLRGKISGLCIPHFIVDIPGGKGKIEINPHNAKEIAPGRWQFESPLDGSLTEIQYG